MGIDIDNNVKYGFLTTNLWRTFKGNRNTVKS